jgi:hypothetical protein
MSLIRTREKLAEEINQWPNEHQRAVLSKAILVPLNMASPKGSLYLFVDVLLYLLGLCGPLAAAILTGVAQRDSVKEKRDDIVVAVCVITVVSTFVMSLRSALRLGDIHSSDEELWMAVRAQLNDFQSGNGVYEDLDNEDVKFRRLQAVTHALMKQQWTRNRLTLVALPLEESA